MDEKLALAQLRGLVAIPGALKVITAEHRCGIPSEHVGPVGAVEEAQCFAYPQPVSSPRHYVIHDVVRLEGPNEQGRCRALTAEGDWCAGRPAALLKRLQEWQAG